jgi:hypothetical protein
MAQHTGLVDAKGQPLRSALVNKKDSPPITGNAFGAWAGHDTQFLALPGGGIVQFDLSKLTLADFRMMRDHYQVNASLSVLSFMQHQSEWWIECDDAKAAEFYTEQLSNNWTMLNRALSQANWAGYSPSVLEWDIEGRRVVLDKVKDLTPEECEVNWKLEDGWAPPGRIPPKFKTYDGIRQFGQAWPIPSENTLWYPLLMEEGDYYGRKLLRAAFTSWFFSILLHLFANRYFERFGEPVPVGRAPFDDEVTVDGERVAGNIYMLKVLQDLRNRSVVVLPNDRTEDSKGGSTFDYDMEYLESQMRGADFERYLTRLDEETSIAIFTPILMMRTAEVGSYNLGTEQMQVYLAMMNAINDDRKMYIDKYVLERLRNYNFGKNAALPRIRYKRLGSAKQALLREALTALIQNGRAVPDLGEIGRELGLTLHEVEETLDAPPAPAQEPADAPDAAAALHRAARTGETARATVKEIVKRVRPQVEQAFRNGSFGPDTKISMGYKRRMESALNADGVQNSMVVNNDLYDKMDRWTEMVLAFADEFSTADSFISMFEKTITKEVNAIFN